MFFLIQFIILLLSIPAFFWFYEEISISQIKFDTLIDSFQSLQLLNVKYQQLDYFIFPKKLALNTSND